MGLNSLGLWDFTVFTINEIENSLFFFTSGDAGLSMPAFVYGCFSDFLFVYC